jgi:DNA-binding transcriptional LysR family regulator
MSTQLDIDLLRNFAAIAEAGVMSRAADRVGRTQAALSQQVKRLELAVQQTLMIRTGRHHADVAGRAPATARTKNSSHAR